MMNSFFDKLKVKFTINHKMFWYLFVIFAALIAALMFLTSKQKQKSIKLIAGDKKISKMNDTAICKDSTAIILNINYQSAFGMKVSKISILAQKNEIIKATLTSKENQKNIVSNFARMPSRNEFREIVNFVTDYEIDSSQFCQVDGSERSIELCDCKRKECKLVQYYTADDTPNNKKLNNKIRIFITNSLSNSSIKNVTISDIFQ